MSHQLGKQGKVAFTEKRLIAFLMKRDPSLSEKEIPVILHNVRRVVDLITKIQKEPQAQISYREEKINGKLQRKRIISTDLHELIKVMDKPSHSIRDVMEKLSKYYPEKKYGRRSKKI